MKDKKRSVVGLMVAAILLIGIAQIGVLPPFEGFDEVAHYSSIRQVAETGTIPVMRQSYISPDVIDYRRHGPTPFHVPITHTKKPIAYSEDEDTLSYADFFADPYATKDFFIRYRTDAPRAPYYAVTEEFNWQAQHPPLYYILMAPVMKASDGLSFVAQLFVLRLVSFLLALAGLIIGMRATLQYADKKMHADYIRAGFLLYPLILPMFYLEFARIGNDCLCLLLFGITWACTLKWLRGERSPLFNAGFGVTLGLGLLTKILFLPVVAGFGALAAYHLWRERKNATFRKTLIGLVIIFSIALVMGGSWYVSQKILTGSMSGSFNTLMLEKQGGLLAGLGENFSVPRFLKDVGFFFISWSWMFSQSNIYIGTPLHAPVFLLAGWLLFGYGQAARKNALGSSQWTPLYFAAPFVAAQIWYVLICEAVGWDLSPGWYMHVIAPAFAMMIGYGMQNLSGDREKRLILQAFLLYAVFFMVIVNWAQASMAAGCALRSEDGGYSFPDGAFCLTQWRQITVNLEVIGWPGLSALAYIGGFSCLLLGLYRMQRLLLPVPKAAKSAARRK